MQQTLPPSRPVPGRPIQWYRQGGRIPPKPVSGPFNTWRWALVWITQLIFYGGCWLTWGDRPALLFDIGQGKFYFFGLVLWPQDALLLALALIIAATGLFLVTSLAGRLFCGFACPQTVYTSLFTWIETRIEGDYQARLKRDRQGAGAARLRQVAKHLAWAALALWTGISFVGYFTPIRELLAHLARFETGPWEAFWIGAYGLFTYVQAGLTREMVCQHMCPYARFQGVMFDAETRSTSYDAGRGEPRNPRRQAGTAADGSTAAGDCVDCGICVQVCPTGIDIRDGLQLQCINCGLCIDACNQVMDKLARPRGLIRFASERELLQPATPAAGIGALPAAARPAWRRPRVLTYAGLLLLFAALGAHTLAERPLLQVDVLRDRGALVRESPTGELENAYTLKLINRAERPRVVRIQVSGLPGIRLLGESRQALPAGAIVPVQVTVAVPADSGPGGSRPVEFRVQAEDDGELIREPGRFLLP